VTGVWPNREQIAAIDRAVGAEKLDRWREVMRAWMLQGNKPTNVGGMLDWYRDGIPQRPGKPANGGNGRASPAPSASTDWAAVARRTNHPQEVTDGGG